MTRVLCSNHFGEKEYSMKKFRVFLLLALSVVIMATACTRNSDDQSGTQDGTQNSTQSGTQNSTQSGTQNNTQNGTQNSPREMEAIALTELRIPMTTEESWNLWETISHRG